MQSKSPANLNSSLLARKGHAVPSPHGHFASIPASFHQSAANANVRAERQHASEETGYDDAVDTEDSDAVAKRPVGEGPRIAMTVRLDHDTHRRLRLLSAHTNKSSQEIFTEALDSYMKRAATKIPGDGCACLANSSTAD